MEKKPLPSKPQKSLTNDKWRPYIRYNKETDIWTMDAIKEEQITMDKILSKIKVIMDRDQLDIIARIVAYMYHDKKDDFKEIASKLRQEHIYKDLRSIDQWLNIQYHRLEDQDERNKNINEFDLEIINEQSK